MAVYDYNGAGSRLALASYPQPSFALTYFQGTSGTYFGLDRFGRVVDQYWKGSGSTSDIDRIHYAYDYAGNRTYRDIDSAIYSTNNLDQAYTYDGLHRLLTSQVGTLSGSTISGTPATEEDWTLDALGNWPNYVTKAGGATNLNQGRTFTAANEVSGVSASVGSTWATPAYDLAGNMTSIPIPSNLTSTYAATYDAWNRLVSLANGSTSVATYSYDGVTRRIVKSIYASGSLDHNEHAYFNEDWQILEVRKEVSGTMNSNPLEQNVWHPFYVDASVLRDYDSATAGSPTRYYCVFDANYNVTAAASSNGTPLERYFYSPYGYTVYFDGSFSALSGGISQIGNALTYTGRQFDSETGLYYYRHRFYHFRLGAFLSRDPVETSDSLLNLYSYVRSAPLSKTDPSGLVPRGDEEGTFNVTLTNCSKDEHPGCCCTSVEILYKPTDSDKTKYKQICIEQKAMQTIRRSSPCWDTFWDWHTDPPNDKQFCWPEKKNGANWTDFPGAAPFPGYCGCPGWCATLDIEQDFEACAIGTTASGTRTVIGCVQYGQSCAIKYKEEIIPGSPAPVSGNIGFKVRCLVDCKPKRTGGGLDIPPFPPRH